MRARRFVKTGEFTTPTWLVTFNVKSDFQLINHICQSFAQAYI